MVKGINRDERAATLIVPAVIVFLYYLFLHFNKIEFFRIDSIGVGVKLNLVYSIVFVFLFVKEGTINRPLISVVIYFLAVIFTSIISYVFFGSTGFMLLFIYAVYVYFIGLLVSRTLPIDMLLNIMKNVTLIMFIIIFVKDLYYYDELLKFLSASRSIYGGHYYGVTIYGGGTNLEATWLALGLTFFLRSRLFYPLGAIVFLISAVYASRTGFVLVTIVTVYKLWFLSSRAYKALALVVGLIGLVWLGFMIGEASLQEEAGGLSFILKRFGDLGSDPGSLGRLEMWPLALEASKANPFGYGFGHSMEVIQRLLGTELREGNLHNVYLQILVETGLHSLVAYLVIVVIVARGAFTRHPAAPLALYLLCYWLAAFVQFRGIEPMMWFILGLYSGYRFARSPDMPERRAATAFR